MVVTDIQFREITDIDPGRGFIRYKLARFRVNGQPHSIRISMPDFDAGRSRKIIEHEAAKIEAVNQGSK